jgi:hypothetical protein
MAGSQRAVQERAGAGAGEGPRAGGVRGPGAAGQAGVRVRQPVRGSVMLYCIGLFHILL